MARFNTTTTRPATRSLVTTTGETLRTYEGATGDVRDARSEAFLLSIANFVGKGTFYEKAADRDDRFVRLVWQLAVEDPQWTADWLRWLRSEGNMRTAPLVGAAEFVRARLLRLHELEQAGETHLFTHPDLNRRVVSDVLQRADEPGELLAYWTSRYGRTVPIAVKRGIGDAVLRLGTEFNYVKWDSEGRGWRFADILNFAHPGDRKGSAQASKFRGEWQRDLFAYAVAKPHRDVPVPESLGMLTRREALLRMPVDERRHVLEDPELLSRTGMTRESLAGWLQGPMDAKAYEAIIPSMGIGALAKNLRNFDQAGVSDAVAAQVCARFTDAEQVAKSRLFPFRWWAAYKHAPSLRWGHALEQALGHSLANVPALTGRTLILVDRSPSMFPGYHFSTPNDSDIPLAEQAALFGSALALRAEKPTLVEFGRSSNAMPVRRGGSVLRLVEQFGQIDGTDIPSAVHKHLDGHDRVVIITDEQTRPGWLPSNCGSHGGMRETRIDDLVPTTTPVYMWNMAGYKPGAMPSGGTNRTTLGGLTDQAFRLIPILEAGRDGRWEDLFNPRTA